MTSIKNLRAAKKFGPGYFIREQMDLRGWVQEELAEILGISTKHLNSILRDKQALSVGMAQKLSHTFDTSAKFWLNLDNDYRLWLEQKEKDKNKDVKLKAQIYSYMPVRDMVKKGWISKSKNIKELENEAKTYWQTQDLNLSMVHEAASPLMRKSEAFNQYNAAYAATWFQMAKIFSEGFYVKDYNKESLLKLYRKIADYTHCDNGITDFINELNQCGVKFILLPHLEKTYLDGAAFIHKGSPVVVYTARYKRIDNFWFTLAHELAHIIKHINAEQPFILDNLKEKSNTKIENEANEMAGRYLKHNEILELAEAYFGYLPKQKIEEISAVLNIHPAISVGALAFNNAISYRNLKLFNENVLEYIPKEYMHDSVWK